MFELVSLAWSGWDRCRVGVARLGSEFALNVQYNCRIKVLSAVNSHRYPWLNSIKINSNYKLKQLCYSFNVRVQRSGWCSSHCIFIVCFLSFILRFKINLIRDISTQKN